VSSSCLATKFCLPVCFRQRRKAEKKSIKGMLFDKVMLSRNLQLIKCMR